jgi:hypothetical protein
LLAQTLSQGNPDMLHKLNFPIENYPFICNNIPAAPAYGVYISQLIRYYRACGAYQDFLERGFVLTRKLLNQGFGDEFHSPYFKQYRDIQISRRDIQNIKYY